MIFCVEDDAVILDIERYALQSAGLQARGFSCGTQFLEALRKEKPELVLLDVMLPDIDGVTLLRRLREQQDTASIPVIMATAKGTEYDKIQSLDLGADDYLVKPFGMMEMISRIHAVQRRCRAAEKPHVLRRGGLCLDADAHTVEADGVPVTLTYKEFALLRLFLSHPGVAFTREQLFSEVWGMEFCGESRTVDMHIRTLRQKLGPYGAHIETVRGVGYRWEEKP